MPAIETKPLQTETRSHCPLCAAALDPLNRDECPKCDWVVGYRQRSYGGSARDRFAVVLSVIPGLGHIYKGHRLLGALLMLGSVFAAFAAVLAGTASAGWGTLLLPIYWAGVMLHVFLLDDLVAKGLPKQ